jgi:hypothetical protein
MCLSAIPSEAGSSGRGRSKVLLELAASHAKWASRLLSQTLSECLHTLSGGIRTDLGVVAPSRAGVYRAPRSSPGIAAPTLFQPNQLHHPRKAYK